MSKEGSRWKMSEEIRCGIYKMGVLIDGYEIRRIVKMGIK